MTDDMRCHTCKHYLLHPSMADVPLEAQGGECAIKPTICGRRERVAGMGDIPTRVTRWQEGTADPIYLLQARRYVCKEGDSYTWGEDGEVWDDSGNEVDTAYMADIEADWEEVWETERVFFTREEADAYGEGHAYNYREGWRSYSVPATGQLRDLLRMLTTMAPRPRDKQGEGGEHG